MKKLFNTTFAGILAFSLGACSTSTTTASTTSSTEEDHLARVLAAGKLTIGLEGDWQPFSYHDEEDNLVGFDVEVATYVAEYLGVEADIVEAPWDGLFSGMAAGTYDVVVNGVDVTEERQKSYDFSDPYAYDHTVLVVKEDNSDITSFEDLEGKTTANSIGSTYMEIGEEYGATVSGVDTLAETMTMVINSQVDATINAATSVNDYINTTKETRIKIVAQSEDATAYAIPLVKGEDNATLLEKVNEALAAVREDGTLKELSEKYFGADLTEE